MLKEQRKKTLYEPFWSLESEYLDSLTHTEYFMEAEESLWQRLKKAIAELLEKIKKILLGEKESGNEKDPNVKVPEGFMPKLKTFVKNLGRFVRIGAKKLIKLAMDNKFKTMVVITAVTTFSVSEFKRRKTAKEQFGTAKRKDLTKLLEDINHDIDIIENATVGLSNFDNDLGELKEAKEKLDKLVDAKSRTYNLLVKVVSITAAVSIFVGNLLMGRM